MLLALCDSRYCFTAVDIGSSGRRSDGAVYAASSLTPELLKIPDEAEIDGMGRTPYVIVGDAAFPLRKNLMRPYPGTKLAHEQRIFNYR